MTREATQKAQYLYCIIKCDPSAESFSRKDEGRYFNGVSAIGGDSNGIHTIVFKDLACVVSDSPDIKYDSTRANLMAHETVIEHVMKEFTVLPIRFGTVAPNSSGSPVADIRRLLASRFQEFQRLHSEMSRRVELGLKVWWRDEKAIYQEIVAEHEAARRLRDSLAGRSPQATHFARIRLGEMVKKALDQKREQVAKMLLAYLQPVAERVRENQITLDRMVLNAALLVPQDRERECDTIVQRLDEKLGERMAFKYVGPTPPFNFCQIIINWNEVPFTGEGQITKRRRAG